MGYLKIPNMYKDQTVLKFDEVFALEKIHGTSAHIKFSSKDGLTFYSGGEKHEKFIELFDAEFLTTTLAALGQPEVTIFGEAYGGKQQGMSHTYGPELKFAAFDVKINDLWLDVPNAETLVKYLKLEFVDYTRGPATLEFLDRERDKDSTQAIRNGMGPGKMREGIVIRPIGEVYDKRGNRVIAKHKRSEFSETKTPREVDPERLKILTDAREIADEFVTPMRLQHVLDKAQALKNEALDPTPIGIEDTSIIVRMMWEDIKVEANWEIVESKEARSAVGKLTAHLFKEYLKSQLKEIQ